ncbi:hypothetical protein ElyMa_005748200 [Elysia marginata]|uniref:Uncharacterized protein n=1 Tax=Elysia marginata TaxID=1093978 RepID=A0AAV4FLG4_9GAST|nr:hypothetical protein ElyMa_005748200 [Elysia marginata]
MFKQYKSPSYRYPKKRLGRVEEVWETPVEHMLPFKPYVRGMCAKHYVKERGARGTLPITNTHTITVKHRFLRRRFNSKHEVGCLKGKICNVRQEGKNEKAEEKHVER